MSAASENVDDGVTLRDLYPGNWSLLLLPLCQPVPHEHRDSNGGSQPCTSPGKRPLPSGWNREALQRYQQGKGVEKNLQQMADHVARGGNIGLAVPPGAVVLDADTREAAAWLASALPDAPQQETARGSHFVLRVPADVAIDSAPGVELAEGVKIDIRSGGRSQIAVEPSTHHTGACYAWKASLPPTVDDLPLCPPMILDRITTKRHKSNATARGNVQKGARNGYLFRIASAMRGRGLSRVEILSELHAENRKHCNPPLEPGEVEQIAESAFGYPAGSAEQEDESQAPTQAPAPHGTDDALAERFVDRHGEDVRFCAPLKWWFVWDGRRFQHDQVNQARARIRETSRSLLDEAAQAAHADPGRAKELALLGAKYCSRSRMQSALWIAECDSGIGARPSDFDRDPYALNVSNGTIDLRSGELREHSRRDLLTKLAPVHYDPGAEAPLWAEFLERVQPNPEAREFLQRAAGYTLTGDTVEELMFVLYGLGANGKSTFLETLRHVLGEYAVELAPGALTMRAHGEELERILVPLPGARLASTLESCDGQRLHEQAVKRLTSGEPVRARLLWVESFEFVPTCKLWLTTNARPTVSGDDDGIWRRILLVPFGEKIEQSERDLQLRAKLIAEAPGILAWAVRGCLDWIGTGLRPPETILAATREYRRAEDVVGGFLDDCCQIGGALWVASADLLGALRVWAHRNGHREVGSKKLADQLRRRGFESEKLASRRGWVGLDLLPEARQAAEQERTR